MFMLGYISRKVNSTNCASRDICQGYLKFSEGFKGPIIINNRYK